MSLSHLCCNLPAGRSDGAQLAFHLETFGRSQEAEATFSDFLECIKKNHLGHNFCPCLCRSSSSGKKFTAGLPTVCAQMHKCSLSLNSPKMSQAHSYLWCKCYWSFGFPFLWTCREKWVIIKRSYHLWLFFSFSITPVEQPSYPTTSSMILLS